MSRNFIHLYSHSLNTLIHRILHYGILLLGKLQFLLSHILFLHNCAYNCILNMLFFDLISLFYSS